MRQRPDLRVTVSPPVLYPGQVLHVEALVQSRARTPTGGVVFELQGIERARARVGGGYPYAHRHVALASRAPGQELQPGGHPFVARFELPRDAPPTYAGQESVIAYELGVRVIVPWWLDRVGRYVIHVGHPPREHQPTPGVFVSSRAGPNGRDLYAEASLDRTVVAAGGVVTGRISLANVAAHRPRRVTVAVAGREHLTATDAPFARDPVHCWTYRVHEGCPREGDAIAFRVQVPRHAVPSFHAAYIALQWAFEVVVEGRWSRATLLRIPIRVVPGAPPGVGGAVTTAVPAPPPPAVGRERHAQMYAAAAARWELVYDPEEDVVRGTRGAVALRVGLDPRAPGGVATVATLAWPSLGLDLELAAAHWTDRLARRRVALDDPGFEARYRASGRWPAQVRALLDADVRAALGQGFADVRVADTGATLASAGALVAGAALDGFVGAVVSVARALDAAMARVPVPKLLAPHEAAWRAFARQLGGRFEPGRGWIHDAAYGLERVELGVAWSAAGEFRAVCVRLQLDPLMDLPAEGAGHARDAAPRAARDLLAELEREGARVRIEPAAVVVELKTLVENPRTLEPLLDRLARLARVLRGRSEPGPFR